MSMPYINQYGYEQLVQLGSVLKSALSVIAQCICFKLNHGRGVQFIPQVLSILH